MADQKMDVDELQKVTTQVPTSVKIDPAEKKSYELPW